MAWFITVCSDFLARGKFGIAIFCQAFAMVTTAVVYVHEGLDDEADRANLFGVINVVETEKNRQELSSVFFALNFSRNQKKNDGLCRAKN